MKKITDVLYLLKEKFGLNVKKINDDYYICNDFDLRMNHILKNIEDITKYEDQIAMELSKYINNFCIDINSFNSDLISAFNYLHDKLPNKKTLCNTIINNYQNNLLLDEDLRKLYLILNNRNIKSNRVIPKNDYIYRMNLDLTNIIDNSYELKFMIKYKIIDNFEFSIIPNIESNCKTLNLLDIAVLRTIFLFFYNNIFIVNNKNIYRYLSSNNSRMVTNKQEKMINDSIQKLKNLDIIVYDNINNSEIREKIIYIATLDKNNFIILRETLLYKIARKKNLYTKLDKKIYTCPISMTKDSLLIKEYLIYRIILNKSKYAKLFFHDIYIHLNMFSPQDKKKARYFIIKILNYWKEEMYIQYFNILINENKYIYLEIFK